MVFLSLYYEGNLRNTPYSEDREFEYIWQNMPSDSLFTNSFVDAFLHKLRHFRLLSVLGLFLDRYGFFRLYFRFLLCNLHLLLRFLNRWFFGDFLHRSIYRQNGCLYRHNRCFDRCYWLSNCLNLDLRNYLLLSNNLL